LPTKKIEEKALAYLQTLEWTGNIRELRNVVERLIILSEDVITETDAKKYA
jgi:two-component system, NtrC family, nitrogen regulation response regulator NtrX